MQPSLSRRSVLGAAAAAFAPAAGAGVTRLPLCMFSKHFHWASWNDMAALVKELGFDGIDLTVREGGHVLPARVQDDLPKAVEIIRQAGLQVPMITAGIVDAESPYAEAIVKAAVALGIRQYRWGGFRYRDDQPLAAQLAALKPRVARLAELNRQYGACAMYHTHSGPGQVGASIWDLWYLLHDYDHRYVGVNFDIGHATVEGGYGGWIHSARLTAPMMRGVALKDFRWGRNRKGAWVPQWCAPGEGMVNFARFFGILKEQGFVGPVQIHYEYPELGDAHAGKPHLSIPRDRFLAILRRDLNWLRETMAAAQLVS